MTTLKAGVLALVSASLLVSAGASAQNRPPAPSAGDRAMMGAMRSMIPVTAKTRPTGDVDRDFMTMMIPHHDAGIQMSKDNASMHKYLRGWKTTAGPVGAGSPSAAMLEDMREMDRATAKMRMTGNQDRDFIEMMIPHHEAAISMARTEMRSGRDARVKKVAKGIFDGQSKDVRDMKGWYKSWYGRAYAG
jgi:uncharacterized protein (DUF305 family)